MTKDRRTNKRLQLTISLATPLKIELHSDHYDGMIPGILLNLSARGMALLVFHYLPEDSRVEFDLNFVGIRSKVSGRIAREEKKFEDTYMVGVEFNDAPAELKETIETMAEDHDICQVRYVINPEEACFPECSFRSLCGHRIKKNFSEVNNDTA